MKKILIAIATLLLVASCNKPVAVVDLDLKDAPKTDVQLYKLDMNRLTLVDSLTTDKNAHLHYKIALKDDVNPAFYYIYRGNTKLAGMVASKGDRLSVSADTLGRYEVEGNDDSRLLAQMDSRLAESIAKMDSILAEAPEDEAVQLSKVYIDHKRAMLRQVMENPKSITSAAALFQKFNDQLYVFQEPTDVYIFKAIRDSLKEVYPNNEFVAAVSKAIEARDNQDQLEKMISEASVGIPEITMNDFSGKEHSLSEFNGKVILLSFWSAEQNEHKVFNQELVPIYEKYHDRGFEIYQVSVDEKTVWATSVRNQNLPWVSVNDGLGIYSPAVSAYNLNSIPTMFIIGRNSDVLAKDVYDPVEIERIIQKAL